MTTLESTAPLTLTDKKEVTSTIEPIINAPHHNFTRVEEEEDDSDEEMNISHPLISEEQHKEEEENKKLFGKGTFILNNNIQNNNSNDTLNNLMNENLSKYNVLYDQIRNLFLHNYTIYYTYYISMIIFSVVLLIWNVIYEGIPHHSKHGVLSNIFLFLEFLLTFILFIEIFCNLVFFYDIKTYFKSYLNILDVSIVIFCFINLLIYIFTKNRENLSVELIDSLFITFRFLIQLARIIILFKNQKKRRELVNPNIEL